MYRKIVAIGGGKNGRQCSDGSYEPYETAPMDKEIIKLTDKEKPNFLFLGHALPINWQEGYFNQMKDIYQKMYGCECLDIKSNELYNLEEIKKKIDWADIIYEGGGNTLNMINLWKDTGFDHILKDALESGKVMCGVSAGASCWFNECYSDSLPEDKYFSMKCLGYLDGLFVPHCEVPGRYEQVKEILKYKDTFSISISNCAALEIVNDKYRLITSDNVLEYGIEEAYGIKTYWNENKYVEEKIDKSLEFKPLSDLLSYSIKTIECR